MQGIERENGRDVDYASVSLLENMWIIFRNCADRKLNETGLSCRRQTRATRCLTPIVLYTKADAQSDKLVTDDRRQFITLSVHVHR